MNNSVYILEDRAILYVNGSDAKDFLQNLISNDINKVTDNSSCFASLFTPQGKFLYEFMNSYKNLPCGVNNDAKQLELSVTLLMSLLIRFCKKSFASEPLT